jgi:hypothetical protein
MQTATASQSAVVHNLDINTYNFSDLLALFELSHTITLEDMKRAKNKVLKMHPDKSRLSPDYYIFYKKAYDIVKEYYEESAKVTREVVKQTYQTDDVQSDSVGMSEDQLRKFSKATDFNARFNEIFEKNAKKAADQEDHSWFTSETEPDPMAGIDAAKSKDDLSDRFDRMRQKTASSLMKYDGYREMTVQQSGVTLYDQGGYKSSDPFSKLPYDDLRKVYKDQPVLAVSEKDYANRPQYANVDEYAKTRESYVPMGKVEGEARMKQQQDEYIRQISEQKYAADRNEAEIRRRIQAGFLSITDH